MDNIFTFATASCFLPLLSFHFFVVQQSHFLSFPRATLRVRNASCVIKKKGSKKRKEKRMANSFCTHILPFLFFACSSSSVSLCKYLFCILQGIINHNLCIMRYVNVLLFIYERWKYEYEKKRAKVVYKSGSANLPIFFFRFRLKENKCEKKVCVVGM